MNIMPVVTRKLSTLGSFFQPGGNIPPKDPEALSTQTKLGTYFRDERLKREAEERGEDFVAPEPEPMAPAMVSREPETPVVELRQRIRALASDLKAKSTKDVATTLLERVAATERMRPEGPRAAIIRELEPLGFWPEDAA